MFIVEVNMIGFSLWSIWWCESCFGARVWSREPIPGPLENTGLVFASADLWCGLHQLWRQFTISTAIGVTSYITTCCKLNGIRDVILGEGEEYLTQTTVSLDWSMVTVIRSPTWCKCFH